MVIFASMKVVHITKLNNLYLRKELLNEKNFINHISSYDVLRV